jgi:hypothetical protein
MAFEEALDEAARKSDESVIVRLSRGRTNLAFG